MHGITHGVFSLASVKPEIVHKWFVAVLKRTPGHEHNLGTAGFNQP